MVDRSEQITAQDFYSAALRKTCEFRQEIMKMNLLMFVPLLVFILITIGLGAITGVIAKQKNRSRALWWVAGAFVFPIALISIFCFCDIEQIPDGQKPASKLKEKIVLVLILVLWVTIIISRVQRVMQ